MTSSASQSVYVCCMQTKEQCCTRNTSYISLKSRLEPMHQRQVTASFLPHVPSITNHNRDFEIHAPYHDEQCGVPQDSQGFVKLMLHVPCSDVQTVSEQLSTHLLPILVSRTPHVTVVAVRHSIPFVDKLLTASKIVSAVNDAFVLTFRVKPYEPYAPHKNGFALVLMARSGA
jgi:hypothetical protein